MEIDKQLLELQEKINRKYSIEKKYNEVNELYFYLKDKLREYTYKLEDLDINVKDLEKKSIIYIWYEIFTSKGKKVTKLEHDFIIYHNLYDYIYNEMIEIKNKLEKISVYEEEYNRLLKEKEIILLDSEKTEKMNIDKLNVEIIKYKNRVRDINEAINAGNYLYGSLKYLVDLLNKTKDWDSFDIFGRGLFLSLTKTPVFKQTEDKVKKHHYLANKFTRELKVISFYMNLTVNLNDIIHYVDYFENKLYDDIKDKNTIINTIDNITKGYDVLNQTLNNLTLNKEKYLKEIIKLENEKNQLMHN